MKAYLIIFPLIYCLNLQSQRAARVTILNGESTEILITKEDNSSIEFKTKDGKTGKIQKSSLKEFIYLDLGDVYDDYITFTDNGLHRYTAVIEQKGTSTQLYKRALGAIQNIKTAYNYKVEVEENKIPENNVVLSQEGEQIIAHLRFVYEKNFSTSYVISYTLQVDTKDDRYRFSIYDTTDRYYLNIILGVSTPLASTPIEESEIFTRGSVIANIKQRGRFNRDMFDQIIQPLTAGMSVDGLSDDW